MRKESAMPVVLLSIAVVLTAACGDSTEDELPLCSAVESSEVPAPIALRIENLGAETIYLAGETGCRDVTTMMLLDSSDQWIQTVRTCETEENNSCVPAVAYKLLPGASHMLEIEAARYETPDCQQDDRVDDGVCNTRKLLPEGDYHFQVSWYSALVEENADCIPESETGACPIYGTAGAGKRSVGSADFQYPADGEVVITIE